MSINLSVAVTSSVSIPVTVSNDNPAPPVSSPPSSPKTVSRSRAHTNSQEKAWSDTGKHMSPALAIPPDRLEYSGKLLSSTQNSHSAREQEIPQSRPLSNNELSYYLPSRQDGVNDMYGISLLSDGG
jgi:hypothetical protein